MLHSSTANSFRRSFLILLMVTFSGLLMAKEGKEPKEKSGGKQTEAAAFFAGELVPEIKLEIASPEIESLRKEAKTYVKCKLVEGDTSFTDIAVKLKGSAGSFQEIDQRPAFTINMDRFKDDLKFHGMDKFHLNNSVQDESCLNELICSGIFNAAGIPAPRVAHARVWLNGKDLGLYVLKESFAKSFLKQHFTNTKGNLYDGGFCSDIDSELERDEGKGDVTRTDLAALAEACRMEKLDERWPRLEALLNVDAFLTFMALEYMTGHWDGYCQNQNNYRLYFDPDDSGRAHFLPHGMDQMFGDPGASILSAPKGMVAAAVMQNPAWRKQYRDKIVALLPLFAPEKLKPVVEKAEAKLKPVLQAMGGEALAQHEEQVKDLLGRLTARAENLKEQSTAPEPKPLEFNKKGEAALEGWVARQETGYAGMEDQQDEGKPRLLMIQCGDGEQTIASWRTSVLLAPGNYRLVAKARCKDLKPLTDEKGTGAGLRISGQNRTNKLEGTKAWTPLSFEFSIDSESQVELVAELRASKGQLWFDAASMKLVKAK